MASSRRGISTKRLTARRMDDPLWETERAVLAAVQYSALADEYEAVALPVRSGGPRKLRGAASLSFVRVPGLDEHHQQLLDAVRERPTVEENETPMVGRHFYDVDLPKCAGELPLLHCTWSEVGDVQVTFPSPLKARATLVVRRGTSVQEHVLEAGTVHAALPGSPFVQMRDGVTRISVQVVGDDPLPPSMRLTSRYVRPVPPPDQTADEKRVICEALRSLYFAHAGTLPHGVRVRVSDIDDLLREYMKRPCILASEVEYNTCPLASIPDKAAVVDGLTLMPRAKAATCDESHLLTARGDVHCAEFEQVVHRTAECWQVQRHSDLLFGLRLEPAVDTDDLVLVLGGSALHLRVRGGTVRLSRPVMLFLMQFHEVEVAMPGFEAYELTGIFGNLSEGVRALLKDKRFDGDQRSWRRAAAGNHNLDSGPLTADMLWENCRLAYASQLVGVGPR